MYVILPHTPARIQPALLLLLPPYMRLSGPRLCHQNSYGSKGLPAYILSRTLTIAHLLLLLFAVNLSGARLCNRHTDGSKGLPAYKL
jgi:hypothetical protein